MRVPILPLLCAAVPMTASASAQHEIPRYAAAEPRPAALALVGLFVLPEDGSRPVGTIYDIVVDANNRPAEIIVASGPPSPSST